MTVTIRHGDCREVLQTLPDQSVHCCVTSPPYFGLRDYGHAGQIGLEATPDAFVAEMVAVFREVRRVLRDDGTLWLNLGDSYAGGGGVSPDAPSNIAGSKQSGQRGAKPGGIKPGIGIKQKDLIGIPWRVAFALQADGWYLRQDIIWSKPNPMPESVTDRCTKAHEYIFLMSKSARYYYDADAVAEASVIGVGTVRRSGAIAQNGTLRKDEGRHSINDGTRNKRSVWEVTTSPYAEAHFATFPPDLIEPCIKAGCPDKCCSNCGAPWNRQTEYGEVISTGGSDKGMRAKNIASYDPSGSHSVENAYNTGNFVQRAKHTIGFAPSCSCDAGIVIGTVLDPFGGAGTTGLVADRLGRDAILIELNKEYAEMAQRRIEGDGGMFAVVSTITLEDSQP